MLTGQQAKRFLKQRHWSYRKAAPLLGVRFEHLCLVLNGHRESRRLLNRIAELPDRLGTDPLKGPQHTPAQISKQEVFAHQPKQEAP
jgi:hypothetical protein